MNLTLWKRHISGSATYLNPSTRAKVMVSKRMFEGDAPDTIDFGADNIRVATEAEAKKAAAKAARGEKTLTRSANLAERLAKTQAKAERLAKQLAAQTAAQPQTVSA